MALKFVIKKIKSDKCVFCNRPASPMCVRPDGSRAHYDCVLRAHIASYYDKHGITPPGASPAIHNR